MYIQKKITAFRYSFKGLAIAWQEESNFIFDVIFGLLTLFFAWVFHITRTELLIVLGMIGLVLSAETFNTALEELCDKFEPTHDPHIAKIKDLAAAAVFITACTAFIVGCMIFVPYLINFFS